MKLLSSEARNSATAAVSAGSASRPSAVVASLNSGLEFSQPDSEGNIQLWLTAADPAKKGRPSKVEGRGMSAAFLQLNVGKDARNVSNDCTTTGTITYDEVPKLGAKAKGSMDVTITCDHVDELPAPLVVKGRFANLPVVKDVQ